MVISATSNLAPTSEPQPTQVPAQPQDKKRMGVNSDRGKGEDLVDTEDENEDSDEEEEVKLV